MTQFAIGPGRLFGEEDSGALFSECRRYRYRLWRIWDDALLPLCFIGLNPSIADEMQSDPTITRLLQRARCWGYGGIQVVNVYALVSTDPRRLWRDVYPIGEHGPHRTNIEITIAARSSGLVLCGWGAHAGARGREVLAMLRKLPGVQPHALKLNKDGSPGHPLYVGYDVAPFAI